MFPVAAYYPAIKHMDNWTAFSEANIQEKIQGCFLSGHKGESLFKNWETKFLQVSCPTMNMILFLFQIHS